MKKRDKNTGNRIKRPLFLAAAIIIMAIVSAVGWTMWGLRNNGASEPAPQERVDTGFVVTGPDSYDSADTAIVVGRDEKENTVTFLNLDLGKRYTLSMDGTTRMYNKYGGSISIDQIAKGDIVDITFLKSKKHLTTMQLSTQAWTLENIERYEMDTARGEISIGSEVYKVTSNTQYLSEGRNVELMDLNTADVLSLQGIGSQILSVIVEKGHGYLRLVNDANFVGGWIEIGQSLIRRITKDMLVLVPEGSYQVNITNKGGGGVKSVVIRRNEETTLDIGDLVVPEPQTGTVIFSLTPATAELYIDGTKVDASLPIVLDYGLHQLIAKADGYQSVTRYINVAGESAGYNVVLDQIVTGGDTTDSGEPEESAVPTPTAWPTATEEPTATKEPTATEQPSATTEPTATETITDYYKVYVDAPEGVEVYLDDNYVGISPCYFEKIEGVHVITLRKAGYETRSYTVQFDDADKDKSYSFADLVEIP